MRAGPRRIFFGAITALTFVLLDTGTALAQLVQSDIEAEPGDPQTIQLVSSSTEVRRAVVGLLALAVVTVVLGVVYWYKTGQQARDRHNRRHGGRHQAEPVRSGVATQANYVAPVEHVEPARPVPVAGPRWTGPARPAEWPRPQHSVSSPSGAEPVARASAYSEATTWDAGQPYPNASGWVGDPDTSTPKRGDWRRDLFG